MVCVTHRWSGMDSNVQFRARLATVRGFVRVGADLPVHGHPSSEPIELSDGVRGAATHRPAKKMCISQHRPPWPRVFSPIGCYASEAPRLTLAMRSPRSLMAASTEVSIRITTMAPDP
jgi:hypothetical protein